MIKEHSNGRAASNGAASTNGAARYQSEKVRVAIVGVGNCASAFVQGVHYYNDADPSEQVPGLMHVDLGGYHIRDIEFTAAFDIDATKVGKDLGEAIWAGQNNTMKFAKVPKKLGVPVYRGMTHDGLGKYLKEKIKKAPGETADIVKILKDTHTDVVVSYLPVGSEQATKWYVEQVLEAGCGFVNCIPVFIAREDYWDKRFKEARLPIVGDDIKSQVGATIVHRTLARLFADRGVKMLRTSQLNVGGNMDFYNMLERERLESKKISKTNAVTSIMDHELPAADVYIGPSDYVPWLTDRKWAHIRVEGQAFGDVPLNVELKLEVWDSPNSAGIVIDAVRCCKLALNHGIGGQLDGPSSYLMKSPHNQRPDDQARRDTEKFIAKYAKKPGTRPKGRKAPARAKTAFAPLAGTAPCAGRWQRARGADNLGAMAATFSIAHVTPYPWEAEDNEVNAHVRRVAGELSRARAPRAGPRAVALAGARARLAPGAARGARRDRHRTLAARRAPTRASRASSPSARCSTSCPARRRRPAALPIDVARTVEELLSTVELDFVHVHEPFAPSTSAAALRHSRALNVGSFHSSEERLLSTLLARRFVESFFGRLDARIASLPATAELMNRHFPGDYRLVGDEEGVEPLEQIYRTLAARRHEHGGDPGLREALAGRPLIDVDLHMHTDHSHDCATPVEVLLATAREQGLGAIAVTDHNEISGALEARAQAKLRSQPRQGDRRRGGQDGRPGRGDRPVHRGEDPARADDARDGRRDPAPGRRRVRAAPVRPHALGARLRAPADDPRRGRRDRGLQPARGDQRVQRRGGALRRQVPHRRGRRLGLARRAGPRLGAHRDARLRRAGGVPAVAARRRHPHAAVLAALRAGAEVPADPRHAPRRRGRRARRGG